jgi:threonine dehydrogenase-like Zn-dependent dehydrogenase
VFQLSHSIAIIQSIPNMTSIFRPSAHALISGGASGIGLAVAELCLKHSMKVTIADFNQETLDLAKKSLKGDVKYVKADVGEKADWKKLKQDVGEVDFLMLNAGVGGTGTWGDEDYFDKVSWKYGCWMTWHCTCNRLHAFSDSANQPWWCR